MEKIKKILNDTGIFFGIVSKPPAGVKFDEAYYVKKRERDLQMQIKKRKRDIALREIGDKLKKKGIVVNDWDKLAKKLTRYDSSSKKIKESAEIVEIFLNSFDDVEDGTAKRYLINCISRSKEKIDGRFLIRVYETDLDEFIRDTAVNIMHNTKPEDIKDWLLEKLNVLNFDCEKDGLLPWIVPVFFENKQANEILLSLYEKCPSMIIVEALGDSGGETELSVLQAERQKSLEGDRDEFDNAIRKIRTRIETAT